MTNQKPDPYQTYNFQVEIDGETVAGFEKASGLTMQMETIEYREGGVNDYIHKLPGQFSHSNLILERGLTDSLTLWQWIDDLKSGAVSFSDARKNVQLMMQKGYKSDEMWGWEVYQAYPVQWDGPDLLSTQDERDVALQTLELAHRGIRKISGTPESE